MSSKSGAFSHKRLMLLSPSHHSPLLPMIAGRSTGSIVLPMLGALTSWASFCFSERQIIFYVPSCTRARTGLVWKWTLDGLSISYMKTSTGYDHGRNHARLHIYSGIPLTDTLENRRANFDTPHLQRQFAVASPPSPSSCCRRGNAVRFSSSASSPSAPAP